MSSLIVYGVLDSLFLFSADVSKLEFPFIFIVIIRWKTKIFMLWELLVTDTVSVTSYLHSDAVTITGCHCKYISKQIELIWQDENMSELWCQEKSFHRNTNKTFRWSSLKGLAFLETKLNKLLTRIWVICVQVKTQKLKLTFFDYFNTFTENISLFLLDRGQSKTKN